MSYIFQILPALLSGVKMTLGIFAITLIGSIPLGLILSVGLIPKPKSILGKAGKGLLMCGFSAARHYCCS